MNTPSDTNTVEGHRGNGTERQASPSRNSEVVGLLRVLRSGGPVLERMRCADGLCPAIVRWH